MVLWLPISIHKKVYSNLLCHHHRDRSQQTPHTTHKKIAVRRVEQFLIAASLLEPIHNTDTNDGLPVPAVKWGLKIEPGGEGLAPLEIIEFYEIIYPILSTTRCLASRDQHPRSYHFLTSQVRLFSHCIDAGYRDCCICSLNHPMYAYDIYLTSHKLLSDMSFRL